MPVKKMNSGLYAVMGIDPGGTTGVSGYFLELGNTVKDTFLSGVLKHKSVEIKGTYLRQSELLEEVMVRFTYTANVEHGIPLPNVHFAIEEYVRRPKASSVDLSSVWISGALMGRLGQVRVDQWNIVWQQPSDAKSFANNERLKLWGVWETGSEHKRDATRHVALRLDGLLC